MRKFLAIAASLAVVVHFAANGGAELPSLGSACAAAPLSEEEMASDDIRLNAILELLAQNPNVKYEPQSPVCFLFGHNLKAGIACLTTHAPYPECERAYYEVTYCERCGYYGVALMASDYIPILPIS